MDSLGGSPARGKVVSIHRRIEAGITREVIRAAVVDIIEVRAVMTALADRIKGRIGKTNGHSPPRPLLVGQGQETGPKGRRALVPTTV